MYSFSITIRRVRSELKVIAESSEPGITTAVRTENLLCLDVSQLPDVPTGYSDRGGLLAYGTALGQAVFAGGVGRAFQRAQRGADQANAVLHVLLSVEEDELKPLRWERMCAELDGTWQFLRLQQRTPFSLHLPSVVDKRYPAISRADLRALVVVANLGPTRPYGLAEFDAAATVGKVRKALGEIGATVLACEGAEGVAGCDGLPTLDEICSRITAERYPILHLVCHGKYFENDGETYLFLRKPADAGRPGLHDFVHRVSASELLLRLGMLQSARGLPHLAFLCSCESADPEAARALGGLGQRLVFELGMPAVVGMTEPVAIPFVDQLSGTFYERLRVHGMVDLALDEACAGVAGHGHVLIPMLFSRLADRTLFDDIGPLTAGEWENGLRRLSGLVDERAPVLKGRFDDLERQALPALEIRKVSESRTDDIADSRKAAEALAAAQAELNELCQDFLGNSFDSLAKGLPLAEPTYDPRCPFPGLGVFDRTEEGDFRPFFFGREELTREVHQILKERRFLAILGGSGTGKSSLVRAGLLEAMRKESPELKAVVFPPGKDPLSRLALELSATPSPDVIVVDQFEEVFTLVADDPEPSGGPGGARKTAAPKRQEFLARLLPLRATSLIVMTLRADFLAECADHDELYALLDADQKYLKLLQPLRGDELRDVMERQAKETSLRFEPGLAARIFQDIESEPGAMPLLQHCLRQLWHFRHGRWLRLAEYVNDDRVGGVKGAISRTAEDVYRHLSRDDQAILPYIFERLARIDTDAAEPEHRRDTRRREEFAQLTPNGGDPEATKRVVTRLADAKLLVTSQNPETGETEVEVAHEVLIRHWDRLRKWLDATRDSARLVDRIRSDATHYFDSKASPDNLTLRGTVLEDAERLIDSKPPRLSSPEVQFIRLCRAYDRERRDRELRTARTRLRLAVSLAGAALVATLLGVYAYLQWREVGLQKRQNDLEVKNVAAQKAIAAERQRDAALSTYAARIGVVERNLAGAHWARAEADLADVMSSSAADVGFETYFLWGQCNRDVIELDTGSKAGARNMVLTNWPLGSTTGVSFLDARTSLVTGNTVNKLTRWNTFSGLRVWEHECHQAGVWKGITSLAYCRQTGEIATAGDGDSTVKIWKAADGQLLRTLTLGKSGDFRPRQQVALLLEFSADGKDLAVLSHMDQRSPEGSFTMMGFRFEAYVLDASSGKEKARSSLDARSIAISADGSLFAAGSYRTVELIPVRPDGGSPGPTTITLERDAASALAFSPTGDRLAIGGRDVTLWDVRKKAVVTVFTGHTARITDLEFSPDGGMLASGSQDATARLWDVRRLVGLETNMGHLDAVHAVSFSLDSMLLATAGADGTTRVWDLGEQLRRSVAEGSEFLFSSDKNIMATYDARAFRFGRIVTNGKERVVSLVDTRTWRPFASGAVLGNEAVSTAVFSPQGKTLALCGGKKWWLIDTETRKVKAVVPTSRMGFDSVLGCFHPGTGDFVTADAEHNVVSVKPETGTVSKVARALALKSPVAGGFLRQGEWLVVADQARLLVLNSGDFRLLREVKVPVTDYTDKFGKREDSSHDRVLSLAVSPGGKRLVTVNASGNAALWDGELAGDPTSLGQDLRFAVNDAVAFSPDGRLLALVTSDRRVEVWETSNPKKRVSLVGHLGEITSVDFSRQSDRVVTGDSEQTLKVWDARSGASSSRSRRAGGRSPACASHPVRTRSSRPTGVTRPATSASGKPQAERASVSSGSPTRPGSSFTSRPRD